MHHTDVVGNLTLRLNIYAGGRDEVFPRTIDLKQDGVDEMIFDPFEIPETDSVRLTLTGAVGAVSDELVVEVPVRPWGVQVTASESGTATDSNTVFVGLPAGRTYDNPEMLIVLSPNAAAHADRAGAGRAAYAPSLLSSQIWEPCDTTAESGRGFVGGDGCSSILANRPHSGRPRRND